MTEFIQFVAIHTVYDKYKDSWIFVSNMCGSKHIVYKTDVEHIISVNHGID